MSPELQAELENLVFAPLDPYRSLDARLQPFLDIVQRAIVAERERCAALCRAVGDEIDPDTTNPLLMAQGITAYALAQQILES